MITRGAPHNRGALFSFLHKRPGDILIQNRDLRHTVRELDGIGQIAAVKLPLPDRPRALVVVAQPKEVFARAHCFEPAELGKGHLRPLHRDRQLFGQQFLCHIRARPNGALRVRDDLAIRVLDAGHCREALETARRPQHRP